MTPDEKKTISADPGLSGLRTTFHRKRLNQTRALFVVLIAAVALICFVFWYRAIPQGNDCYRQIQRIQVALNQYLQAQGKFPPNLEILGTRAGRYNIEHYEYILLGLGGSHDLPEGSLIAYCNPLHRSSFGKPWRHVLIFTHKQIEIRRVTEDQFRKLKEANRPFLGFP